MKKSFDEYLVPIRIRRGDFFSILLSAYREEGLHYILRTGPKYLSDVCFDRIPTYISFCYYKWFKSSETFDFDGDEYNEYNYFFHPYCNTWKNERRAVIPIVWNNVLEYQAKGKNILEIGNMTSYFYNVKHDVLDKYELTDGSMLIDRYPLSQNLSTEFSTKSLNTSGSSAACGDFLINHNIIRIKNSHLLDYSRLNTSSWESKILYHMEER